MRSPNGNDRESSTWGKSTKWPKRTGRSSRPFARLLLVVKTTFALASAMVLLVAGYGWVNYSDLQSGIRTSNVAPAPNPDGGTDILLVGADSRTDAQGNPLPEEVLSQLRATETEGNLTDTLILLHIPNDGSKAVASSFPRDAYVSIPGHGQHKINSAFGYGKHDSETALRNQGVTDPAEIDRRSSDAGRKVMLETVEQLAGVSIDHYAEVNLLGFHKLTQAIGGVPVCLKEPVHDSYSGANFEAGPQKVSGADALAFVRQRHGMPRGDLDRVVRQQAFLAGLARTMSSGGVLANPSKLSDLIHSVQQSIVLDDGWDVMAFAQRVQGLANGSTTFNTIPIEDMAYQTPDGEAVKVDPSDVREAIRGEQAHAGPHRLGPAPQVSLDGKQRQPAQPRQAPQQGPSQQGQRSGEGEITAGGVPCVN